MTTTEHLKNILDGLRSQGDHGMETFKRQIAEGNYAYAFSWGESAITAAARVELADKLARWVGVMGGKGMEPDQIVKELLGELTEMVMRGARYPARSTSAISNEMETARVSVAAEMLESLQRIKVVS